MSINLASRLSAITTDSFGVSHLVWAEGSQIFHAVYDDNSVTWDNATAIASVGTEPVTSLNLVANPNLIQVSSNISTPGLAVVWQQGSDNNSDFNYTAAQYDQTGQLQWLANPQPITSDQVADLEPTVLAYQPAGAGSSNPEVLVVGTKVNLDNAANQAIREDTDLYFQQFSVSSSLFTTDNTANIPIAPYEPQTATNGLVNLGVLANNGPTPPVNAAIAPASASASVAEEFSTSNAVAASAASSSSFGGAGAVWNAQLAFSSNFLEDWKLMESTPKDSFLRAVISPWLKNWELEGVLQGGQSPAWGNEGKASIFLDTNTTLKYKTSKKFGAPWKISEIVKTSIQVNGASQQEFESIIQAQSKSPITFALQADSKYKFDPSSPYNLQSITDTLSLTASMKFPIIPAIETGGFFTLDATGSLGLNWSVTAKPTTAGGSYVPQTLGAALTALGTLSLAEGALLTAFLRDATAESGVIGAAIAIDLAATLAAFIEGQTQGLTTSGTIGFPVITGGLAGKFKLPDTKLVSLDLKAQTSAAFNWGLQGADNTIALNFPLGATLWLGPVGIGFNVKPGWKWNVFDGSKTSNGAIATPTTLAFSTANFISTESTPTAFVEGSLLTVDLGTTFTQLPQAGDFTVTVTDLSGNLITIPVFNVLQGSSGTSLVLQLTTPIPASQNYDYTTSTSTTPSPTADTVQLSFTNQEGLQDSQGNLIPNVTNLSVVNNTPDTQTTTYNPTNGNSQSYSDITLVLSFNTPLNPNLLPDYKRFTVQTVGSNSTSLAVQSVQITSNSVILTFNSSVTNEEVQNVTISYNNGISSEYGNLLTDANNNALGSFTINNGVSAQVSQSTIFISGENNNSLAFSSTASDYAVSVTDADGNPIQETVTVQNVTVNNQGILLTINQNILPTQNAIVTYQNNQLQTNSLVVGITPPAINTQSTIANVEADLGQDSSPTLALIPTSSNSFELLIAWVSDVPPITPIAGFVSGNVITLNFVNDLGNTASSDPATTQFTVTDQNNNSYAVTNISVVGNSLTLTLAQSVSSDTQLTVGYSLASPNGDNQNLFLTDATSTKLWVDDFSAFALTNTTGNTTNSPQLIGAGSIVETSASNQITLVFDQKLNGNPTMNDFTVQSNGVNFTIAPTVTVNDNTVVLSVQPTSGKDLIGVGDIVSVSYSGSELSGANGTGSVADFSNIPVITAPPEPTTVIKYSLGLGGNLSSIPGSDGFNFYPVAAVDQNSNGVVVWVHADSSDIPTSLIPGEFYTDNNAQVINDSLNASDIYYSIYDTTTGQWSLAEAVFAQAGTDTKVALGMGPNNNLMASWINSNNGVDQIYWSSLSYLQSGAPSWSTPQVLYSKASPDPLTELTISSLGGSKPAVFWTETQPTSYTQLTTEALPILYFRLDETSGTLANNEGTWGAGGNGTYSGAVSFNQIGALENTTNNSGDANPATLFNAGNSLTLPNAIGFAGNSFSIEFWFKVPGVPSEAIALVSMAGLASLSFDGSALSLAIADQTLSSSGITFAANQWYYVVASYDGQADTAALFVNGQPVANQENLDFPLPTTTNIILASASNTSGVYLDEVAFYSRVLSYSDVSASTLQSPDLTGYQLAQIMLTTNEVGNKYDAQYVTPLPPGPNTYYVTYDSSSGSWGNTSSQIEPNYKIVPTQLADANRATVDIVANTAVNTDVSAGQSISPNGIEDTVFQSVLTGYQGKTITGITITVDSQLYLVGSAGNPQTTPNQLGVMVGEVLINSLNPQKAFSYTVLSNSVNLDLIIDTGSAPSSTSSATSYTLYFSDGTTATPTLPTYVPPNSEPLTAGGASVLGTATVTEVNDSSLALINSGFIIPTSNPAMGYVLASADFNNDGYSDVAVGNRGYTDTSGMISGEGSGQGSVQILFGQQAVLTNGETNPLTPTDLSGNPNGLLITGIYDYGQANGDYPLSLATGDVNGDGYDDLIIGAPNVNDQQGAVYVIYGSSSLAGQTIDVTTMSSTQGYTLNAPTSGQTGFGFSVATGNFNGDSQGQVDIAVGAPGEVQYSSDNKRIGGIGAVYVFQDGTQSSSNPLVSNDSSSYLFGYSLAVSPSISGKANTFSGNTSDDLIIGIPGYTQEVTNTWTGLNNLPSNTNQQNSFPSSSSTSVGQVQVWQSNGTSTNTFTSAWASFAGPNLPSNNGTANDFLAGSALAVQDWDGDGHQDLAIAAPGGYNNTGVVYIIKGGNSLLANTSPQSLNTISNLIIAGGLPLSQTGAVITSPGDVNDDGYQDFLIAAPQGANGTGQSYIIFGRSKLLDNVGTIFDLNVTANDNKTTFLLNGNLPYQLTGTAVGGIGDINNDGVDDFMISAPNAGQLYAVYGHPWLADDGSIKLANISGDNGFVTDGDLYLGSTNNPLSGNGQNVVMLGDINGDGFADVLSGGSQYGAVIIFGNSTKDLLDAAAGTDDLIITVENGTIADLVALGDFNGDGFQDFGVIDSNNNFYSVLGSASLGSAGTLNLDTNNPTLLTDVTQAEGVADYNGDGYDDVLLTINGSQTLYKGNSQGTLNSSVSFTANGNTVFNGIGDINGDGYSDIGGSNPNGTGQATVYYGNTSASSATPTPTPTPPPSTSTITTPSNPISGILNNNDWGFYNLDDQQTDIAPSFVVFNGYLYMVYNSNSLNSEIGTLYIQRSADGYNWEGLTNLGSSFETVTQASLGVAHNTLYLAFTATDNKVILAPASLDSGSELGVSFSSSTFFQIDGQTANSGPTLVTYDTDLYIFFEGQNSSIRYNSTSTSTSSPSSSSSWNNSGMIPGQSTRDRIGATVVEDTLIVSFLSSNSDRFYTSTTTDGSTWITNEISGQSTLAGPSLATVDDTAYLFFRSSNNNQELLYITSKDQGATWSSQTNIPGQTTFDRPSPVFFQESLLVGFAGTNQAINISTSNPIFEPNQTQQFGQQLQNIGDFNGDGIADFAVLAPGFLSNLGSINNNLLENNQGAVLIYYGTTSGIASTASPDVVLAAPPPNASTSVANNQAILLSNFSGAGDINGDGYDDLLIASPNSALNNENTTDGAAFVIFGGSTSLWGTTYSATNSFNLGNITPQSSTLILQFDQPLIATDIPSTSTFSVKNGLGNIPVNGVAFKGTNEIILTLASNANISDFLEITYTQPASGTQLTYATRETVATFIASSSAVISTTGAPTITLESYSGYGFAIAGLPNSQAGISLSGGGDVNGDGFSDFIIGAPGDSDNLTYTIFGSDFNNTVSQTGTIGDDVMLGSATGESFLAGQGNDQIYGNGGLDVVYAGPGDDYVTVTDTYFQRLDGGTGTDVLAFTGYNGQDWDLTTLSPGLRLRNFEILVTENYGANTLTLNSLTVTNLSSNNTLSLVMDDADTLILSSDFIAAGTVYQYNQKFYKYITSSTSAATILVNQAKLPTFTAPATNIPKTIVPVLSSSNPVASSFAVNSNDSTLGTQNFVTPQSTPNAPTQLFVSNPTVAELDGVANFTIQRTGDLNKSVLVSYITQDGDGKAGDRYLPVVGQFVFAPNETSKTVTVKIPNNGRFVGDRQFGLLVSLVKEGNNLAELPLSFNLEADANGEQIRRWSLLKSDTQQGLLGGTLQFDATVTNQQAQINLSVNNIGDFNTFHSYNSQTNTYEELMLNTFSTGATFTYSSQNENDTPDGIQLNFKDGDRGDVDNTLNGLAKTNGYAGRTIPGLITNNNQTFWAPTTADGQVQWRLIGAPSGKYELGWIAVDDQNGMINGLAPTDAGYEAAALARKQMVFQDQSSSSHNALTRTLAKESFTNSSNLAQTEGQFFGNFETSNLIANQYYMLYSTEGSQTTFSTIDTPEVQTDSRGYHQLSFNGLTAEIGSSTLVIPGILNQTVSVEASLSRAAAYNNLIALYRVDSLTGGLDMNGDKLIDLKPGDLGYSEAALTRAKDNLAGVILTTPENLGTTQQTINLLGNNMYGMVIIPNATIEQVLSQNPSNNSSLGPIALFSFGSANPDGISHMARLGSNLFGFEDILGGGDLDYNDMILQIEIPSLI